MANVSGCIVTYNNDQQQVLAAINSFFSQQSTIIDLFIVDHSPSDSLRSIVNLPHVNYIHNPSNPGFGAGHNIAINLAIKAGSKYHFVINPDIHFHGEVVSPMIRYMEENPDVGMMMPQVLNSDLTIQYLPKLLPHPSWIGKRKFRMPKKTYQNFIDTYELRRVPPEMIYNAPILSGCFTLLKLKAIEEVGGFDEKFFLYFEDFDLSRRVHEKYKTIYFPRVSVVHGYQGGAGKNLKLFGVFISSAIHYFNKWGWLFDKTRKSINQSALSQFKL